ncbi:glycosyltransferase [Salibacterium lacus]|uniref:Glycosyltransferase n=1 Tax=Salibacterium lacus TaxID=1898109 RepID=A0ABW5T3D9_9BACI
MDSSNVRRIVRHFFPDTVPFTKTSLHNLEKKAPHSASFYFHHAWMELEESNRKAAAWLWCWRGLYHHPDNTSLLLFYSILSYASGRETEASLAFQKAENLDKTISSPFPLFEKKHPAGVTYPRVLQGTMEIANQMNTIAKGLTQQGYINDTLNYYPTYLGYSSDYEWKISKERSPVSPALRRLAETLIPSYDMFHFHFGTSLTDTREDLALLQQAEKSVLMHHWGSDARILSEAEKTNPFAVVKVDREYAVKQNLETLGKTIPACIVADREMYQYVYPFYSKVFIVPLMIDVDAYPPHVPDDEDKPLNIVHAPTSPAVKGTSYITAAVSRLQQKYNIDFQLVQGVSHEDAKTIYQGADIIIDQLHIGSYGLLAVEAMAMGKPVVCWISGFMRDAYPDDLPIVPANPETVEGRLEELIRRKDQLPHLGRQGRQFVEKYHDFRIHSGKILDIYRELSNP